MLRGLRSACLNGAMGSIVSVGPERVGVQLDIGGDLKAVKLEKVLLVASGRRRPFR